MNPNKQEAILIEDTIEKLQLLYEGYLLSSKINDEETNRTILRFIEWAIKQEMDDLNTKRVNTGKSFKESNNE